MLSTEREGIAAGAAVWPELAVTRQDVVEAADKSALSRIRDSATEGADELVDGERLAAGGRMMGRAVMYSMSKIAEPENRRNQTHSQLTVLGGKPLASYWFRCAERLGRLTMLSSRNACGM